MISRLKGVGSIFIILGIIVLLILGNISSMRLDVLEILGIKTEPPTTAKVFTTQTIVNSIQPMGQLVSMREQYAIVDIFVGVQQGVLNACGFSANHAVQGTVEAGIDLTKLKEDAVSYNASTSTYTLSLPVPQLTSCRIDYIDQYDTSTTACSADWDAARQLAQYDATSKFATKAKNTGILDRAQAQTELTLGNFIKFLHKAATGNDADVKINFDTSKLSELPESCISQLPQGWVYDEGNKVWTRP